MKLSHQPNKGVGRPNVIDLRSGHSQEIDIIAKSDGSGLGWTGIGKEREKPDDGIVKEDGMWDEGGV